MNKDDEKKLPEEKINNIINTEDSLGEFLIYTTPDGEKTGNYTITYKVKNKENIIVPEESQPVEVRYYEKLSLINCVVGLDDERPSLGVWMCVISIALIGVQVLSYKLKIS